MSYNVNKIGIIIENDRGEFLLIKDNKSDKLKFPFTGTISKYKDDASKNEIYTLYYLLTEKMGLNINTKDSLFYRKKMRLRPQHMFYSLYYDTINTLNTVNTKNSLNNIDQNTDIIIKDFKEKHNRGVITKYNYECRYEYFWMNEEDINKNIDNVNIDVRKWITRDDICLHSVAKKE
jgi:hypothetical protein